MLPAVLGKLQLIPQYPCPPAAIGKVRSTITNSKAFLPSKPSLTQQQQKKNINTSCFALRCLQNRFTERRSEQAVITAIPRLQLVLQPGHRLLTSQPPWGEELLPRASSV